MYTMYNCIYVVHVINSINPLVLVKRDQVLDHNLLNSKFYVLYP